VRVGFKKDNSQPNSGLLKIEVKDSGCGISEKDQKKLFSPFTMLGTNKNLNPNGTGMGLSICKRIAESLGGSVWVSAEPNLGSTFGFSLKCEMPNSEEIDQAGFEQDFMCRLPDNIHEMVTQFGPQQNVVDQAQIKKHNFLPVENFP